MLMLRRHRSGLGGVWQGEIAAGNVAEPGIGDGLARHRQSSQPRAHLILCSSSSLMKTATRTTPRFAVDQDFVEEEMNRPLINGCMVLAALVGAERAAGAAEPEGPTLYVSRLPLHEPLSASELRSKDTGKLNYFCTEEFKKLSPETGAVLATHQPPLQACSDDRALYKKGDQLRVVYVVVADTCPTEPDIVLDVQEHVRKTAAAAGFSAIADFITKKVAGGPAPAAAAAAAAAPKVCFFPVTYTLVYDRAIADVSFSLKAKPDEKVVKQIITGPIEHWFLSGDAVVKGVKELRYDRDQKAVFSRDKPEQLYLGINWMKGDVYGKYKVGSPERIVGKLMLSPTRHPFDSFGLGVGYRFADFSSEGTLQPNGGFILFVGHFWSKNEQVDAAGVVNQSGRSRSWRLGVSYGLDSLLGWLK